MNIGVMGGTFDPVHLGHLALAEEAFQRLGMSEVIFMPAGQPYFKAGTKVSSSENRVNMLHLALAGNPHFKVSLLEIQRSGPTYAIDTLSQMKKLVKADNELFFILGWDSLLTLPHWRQPGRLLKLCQLVVAPRPGYPRPDLRVLEEALPGISARTVVMEKPLLDISSTEIRERVRQGLPIDHLVPWSVAEYIRENSLYTW